MIEGLHL